MSYYDDVPRDFETVVKEGAEWRSLASAVVLRAIYDWEVLCNQCAAGKVFSHGDKNFIELEIFFRENADPLLHEVGITGEDILKKLMPKKEAAMTKRRKLEKQGKLHDFGARLKKNRIAQKLPRHELASRIGVEMRTIERWETGETTAPKKMQEKAIQALNMSWADFFL